MGFSANKTAGRPLLRIVPPLVVVFALLAFALPVFRGVGCDFIWRYNEALCVRSGADPFDVCFHGLETPRFRSVFQSEPREKLPVNAYTPWEYTWMLPLTFLPLRMAHALFLLLNAAALALLAALVRRHALRQGLDTSRANGIAALACFLGLALVRVLDVSNYGLILATAAILLAEDLYPVPALCALMIKPQIGLPFAIALLLARRFRTVVLSALACAVSVLPAALLCHTNPVRMVARVVFSGTHSIRASEVGTALLPPPVVSVLSRVAPVSFWLAASAGIGLAFLLVCSWRLRRHPDAWIRLVPAAVCGVSWMQGHFHDRVILALPIAAVSTAAIRRAICPAVHILPFCLEFWLVIPAVPVALCLSTNPLGLIQSPFFRTVFDLVLCLVAWWQMGAVMGMARPGPRA